MALKAARKRTPPGVRAGPTDDIGDGVDDAMFGEPPAVGCRQSIGSGFQNIIHRQNTLFSAVWLSRDGQDLVEGL
jgi:hypothetical protein